MKKLAAALSTLIASQVFASQCVMPPPEAIAKEADIAFIGKVASVQESKYQPSDLCWARSKEAPQCGGKLVTFEITETLRGGVTSKTTVVSQDACYCLGPYWKVGSSYLVVASPNKENIPGELIAWDVCGGTGELNEITRPIVKALRATKP